jgi:spore coat polysaccharide biosynthesis predicted glycosyltransferase SpsG
MKNISKIINPFFFTVIISGSSVAYATTVSCITMLPYQIVGACSNQTKQNCEKDTRGAFKMQDMGNNKLGLCTKSNNGCIVGSTKCSK